MKNSAATSPAIANALRAANGAAHLPVADGHERQIDDGQPDRQRHRRRLCEQHADAGHAAVDEVAGQQEALQAHTSRENPGRDERGVDELFEKALHDG
jgi:hypothetical protein